MIKKVVHLFSPGPFGGAENIVLNGVKELETQLWLIRETRNPGPHDDFLSRCREKDVAVSTFECRSRLDLNALKEMKKKIVQEKVSIVHSHGMKANFYCSLLPAKRVGTQHGKTSHDAKVRLLEWLEDIALKRMNAMVCVSRKMKDFYRHKNLFVVENFMSLRHIERQPFQEENEKLRLLFIGRISQEKGLADLLRAIKDDQSIYLTVLGDGPERAQLESSLGDNKNIVFRGFQKDITPFLANSDALIMPSHREGLPLSAIEAAAAGVPILASAVGALPQLVKRNGVLFEPQNSGKIKRGIEIFRARRDEINSAAMFGAPEVRRLYSPKRWAKETKQIYNIL